MRRRRLLLAVLALGALCVSAAALRPGPHGARSVARAVGLQLAAGDAAALAREALPSLVPFLADGHLQAAALPVRGARLAAVRVVMTGTRSALAYLRYSDGRGATVRLADAGGGWRVAGLY